MYGKIFESMYDGTISVNWKALVTFQQMIILCDSQGIIDITPPALSRRTNIPLDIIEEGIKYLAEPDEYSRSPDCEGRRIVLIDDDRNWGWRIVNYDYYKQLASRDDKRTKDAARLADKRANAKKVNGGAGVANSRSESQSVADVAYVNVNVNVNKKDTTASNESNENFENVWNFYPKRAGSNPKSKALKAWNARVKQGEDPQSMHDGAWRYMEFCAKTGKEHTEYVKQAATFFGPDKHYLELWELPSEASNGNNSGTKRVSLVDQANRANFPEHY